MLSEISQANKSDIAHFHTYVESRPKMIMMIMGHECKKGTAWDGRIRGKGSGMKV
jgi:hypothetical protein